jgi:glycosyltransferase involved in cell wall biosynthesis
LAVGFDEIILVDYACPQKSGAWVSGYMSGVRVISVPDGDPFNLSRARNIGAEAATGDWLMFLDADIAAQPGLPDYLRQRASPGLYFRTPQDSNGQATAWGSFATSSSSFRRAGGYDEVYRGWGCEDADLYYKLEITGCREAELPARFLSELSNSDTERVLYNPVQQKAIQQALNLMYLQAKKHAWVVHRRREELPLEWRQGLYQAIMKHASALSALHASDGPPVRIQVRLPSTGLRTVSPVRGKQSLLLEFEFTLTSAGLAASSI